MPTPSLPFDIRILVVPGLHDSGPAHWQTWLQSQYRHAVRVEQRNWEEPELDAWAKRIAETIAQHGPKVQWIAVAHSFGCLALAHYLAQVPNPSPHEGGVKSALLVAPADPIKFDVSHRLPTDRLHIPSIVIGSEDDPWMPLSRAQAWAQHWDSGFINLGRVGHINSESGFGPWSLARHKVDQMIRHQQRQHRIERVHRMELQQAT